MDLADRDLTAYLAHPHPDEQPSHRLSRPSESDCSITSGARQGDPIVLCNIATASPSTASEHLRGPELLRLIRGDQCAAGVRLWRIQP